MPVKVVAIRKKGYRNPSILATFTVAAVKLDNLRKICNITGPKM